MQKKPILLLLPLLLAWSAGRAQQFRMQSLTVADGLSQGYISCLYQDRRGFIWIGTFDGLNRYDGYRIKSFSSDLTNPWSLRANFVYSIAEDAQGLLWIGTDHGPVVMDPFTERFIHLADIVAGLPDADVAKIIPWPDGRLWISHRQQKTSGICAIRPCAGLARLIREGRTGEITAAVERVRLPDGVTGPTQSLEQIGDTVLTASDAQHRLLRIDPATLIAHAADPRQWPYQRVGNYGALLYREKSKGVIFLPAEVPQNQVNNLDRWSEFIQLPDGQRILFRAGENTLYRIDTLSSRRKIPGYQHVDFYRQFQPYFKLDKSASYANLVDRAGNLWIGTTGYGVRKISRGSLEFRHYLPNTSFYNFTLLPDGRIWPGIYRPTNVLNPKTGQSEPAPWQKALPKNTWVYGLLITRTDEWWMTVFQDNRLKILKREQSGNQWLELPTALEAYKDIPAPMMEDRHGNVWIAANGGQLLRIRPGSLQAETWNLAPYFNIQPAEKYLRSTAMAEDAGGNIWIGYNRGIIRMERPGGMPVFEVYRNTAAASVLFSSEWILSLYPDPKRPDILWAGTRGGGLNRFDVRRRKAEYYTEKDGLPNNVVYGILPDSAGHLWLSTNRGLSRFNPSSGQFTNFYGPGSALNTEFNTASYKRLPSGELAFGSTEGLFILRPGPTKAPMRTGVVALTHMEINGVPLNPAEEDKRLKVTTDNNYSLQLPFNENNLILEFAALQTSDPAAALYRYRVVGLNNNWISTGQQRTVNLAAIPPGNYELELQTTLPGESWEKAPVTCIGLQVAPPWHRSWPAYLCYCILALLLFRGYIRLDRKRVELNHAVDMSVKEMERLKSLDDFKNRFFAYITHEFKTPLTIILGIAERLAREKQDTPGAVYTEDIIRQGRSMLELVDQMVDITRQQEQTLRLQWRRGNLIQYLRYLVESFRPLTDFRDIRLAYVPDNTDLVMDYDPLRLKYVINNLLSNAVRHTKPGGSIRVRVEQPEAAQVRLEVSDTGAGIAPENLPRIFERYFQAAAGAQDGQHFGLGLAFVRDIVQSFNGSIQVQSQPGVGTTFTITLPITQNAPVVEHPNEAYTLQPLREAVSPSGDTAAATLPQLLVVEDNPVIASYLQLCLRPYFRLSFAADGETGWKHAMEQLPDLILTDVMLPGMDGIELTGRLKAHDLTAHIPVVILSARSELADRLSGHQQGADAYLAKPFNEQELILVLQNLYGLQRRWLERYAAAQTVEALVPGYSQTGEAAVQPDGFMEKLYAKFEKHYPEETYDLAQLCRDLEISKSQLQRKLAAVSDQSAMQLLRWYRLKKAYDILLQDPDQNVKEICFQVGFKDPSHFSRLFTKVFHVPPSEVKRQ